jgi:hypothetical protein
VEKSRVGDDVRRSAVGAAWLRKKDCCIGRAAMVGRGQEGMGLGGGGWLGLERGRQRLVWGAKAL